MKKLITATLIALTLATAVFAQAPKLSEVEQLKIQIMNLQVLLRQEQQNSAKWIASYGQCQSGVLADMGTLEGNIKKLQDEINKSHPDFSFDITTGKFSEKKAPVEKK